MSLVSGVMMPAFSALKGDVGGHQLGERCGEPGNVGILGVEYGGPNSSPGLQNVAPAKLQESIQ